MNRGFIGALCLSVAFAFLAACGGSQPPIGTAMSQSRAIAQYAARGKSWISPGASGEDLLYATGGCQYTCVLSYPQGKLVGTLEESGSGICADDAGNVFITEGNKAVEYAHGGTEPIQTLDLQSSITSGCAVDSLTNSLAVVSDQSAGNVAVFANETGSPTLYSSHIAAIYLGYDDQGNLFVDGYNDHNPGFAELSKNGNSFETLSIPSSVGQPGQVQWDGSYITYQSRDAANTVISRLAVSGSAATVVGSTTLSGIDRNPSASWLFGAKVIVPYPHHGGTADRLGYWKYPKGGGPTKVIKRFGDYKRKWLEFEAVTVSVAPSR